MNDDATAEIEEFIEQLVPPEQVRGALERLLAELQGLGSDVQVDGAARAIARVSVYLARVLKETETDIRLLLDCVCSLCWAKQTALAERLPAHLTTPGTDPPELDVLLAHWQSVQSRASLPERDLLAEWTAWVWLGQLVSRVVYLVPGEATETLSELLERVQPRSAWLN